MPRESIQMNRNEVLAFLERMHWGALGTLDASGSPVADVVPCRMERGIDRDPDGNQLLFALEPESKSAENIARDPRVCWSADEYPSYAEIRGATLHGRARRQREDGPEKWPGLSVYALEVDDVVSFDFAKIRQSP